MAWQDWALVALTPIFLLGLLPSLLDKRTQIPRTTSIPTALAALTQAVLFATLSLWWTAAGTAVIALGWGFLVVARPVRSPSP